MDTIKRLVLQTLFHSAEEIDRKRLSSAVNADVQ